MGIYKLPTLSEYWRRTGIGAMPWFWTVFSKNRFFAISKYLHANDKTKRPEQGQDGYKLFHVQRIIDSLLQAFRLLYTPGRELSIDEQMVVKLVSDLLKEHTLACGTIQAKRVNLPTDISDGNYYHGQVKFWSCGNLSVVHWKFSSWHSFKMLTIPPRRDEADEVHKPEIIHDYNEFMRGVDLCD
ncbi:Hypothetical predicted protein [Paramuricea clavata]|uniref:Uncharacterized protein n=1 Tax=Paramuricea clavata TaxID=317549 RepID=A0A7D9DAY7_PARCT|nr:Hypothetical predicted protein [Paramuricea clavata]